MIRDINKNTIDFQPNFDGEEHEPVVLPARFPNLLVNGTTGIAVGMATNIPPHNLTEVINACLAYMENPEIDVLGLMEHIKGPDLPTGALILGLKVSEMVMQLVMEQLLCVQNVKLSKHMERQKHNLSN